MAIRVSRCSVDFGLRVDQWRLNNFKITASRKPLYATVMEINKRTEILTLFRITSYAEMRSVATKSNVLSSISKISRTLPEAIFLMLYWLRSTLVTAVLEAMMYDLSGCVYCVYCKMLSCVACWWVVRLGLANDWSLDLSSCEVGEFASLAGSLQSASQHSMLHTSLPFTRE